MKRLGYERFVAQGGDWGAAVAEQMALQQPPELLGIHVNLPATVPGDLMSSLRQGQPPPPGLSAEESAYIALKLALSESLKNKRIKKGLSQTALAELIASSQSRIAKMEAADASVSIDLLVKSLLALGTSPAMSRRLVSDALATLRKDVS